MEQGGTSVHTAQRRAVRLAWAARTVAGKVRSVNEDSLVARAGLFAVADGMGGHAAGDVASRMVAEHLESLLPEVPLPIEALPELVANLNAAVHGYAERHGARGMGTTLVAALLVDNAGIESIVIVNVGDSRGYVYDAQGLRALTRDHSLVQELVDAGRISTEEARRHPERNVVTRAIGAGAQVVADYVVLETAGHWRLLLCSDGVSGQVDDAFLADVLCAQQDPAGAVDAIIDRVLSGRAPDNASAIVVDAEWDDTPDADVTGPRLPAAGGLTGPRPGRASESGDEIGVPGLMIDAVPLGEAPR